jgi:hypothetical protein
MGRILMAYVHRKAGAKIKHDAATSTKRIEELLRSVSVPDTLTGTEREATEQASSQKREKRQ